MKYYSKDGEDVLWRYDLIGDFSINEGVSAICTASRCEYATFDSSWNYSNCRTYIESNIAHGVGTFTEKFLFITTDTVEVNITMSCDIYGNFK